IYTCQDGVTSPTSLGTLKRTLSGLTSGARKRHDPRQDLMRSIADYQFGSGAGKLIIPDGATIKAPFPKHQVFLNKEQIATLVPQYGIIALTVAGARRLLPEEEYIVTIDDFVPKGSILAPGITGADPQIRINDEVIVIGKRALCIGRALMSGREMQESSRGIAVDLRHVKKIH
ncbi:MAG: PUA domain-containing protein, partial [Methanosarcinaceae archaeon]